jgi:FixJ family two-component response regulator
MSLATVLIAIVDDDEPLCRSLARVLRRAGFDALTFVSAEDFLAAPEKAYFKCLVLDIQLGGISGIELHQRLLAQGDRTPVIYMTARTDMATRAEATNSGCAGFFLKPAPSSTLIEVLHKVTKAP